MKTSLEQLQALLFLAALIVSARGFGSLGPIAASFGDNAMFCAIDASGKQDVICWNAQNGSLHQPNILSPIAALSGGEGFICGILANTSQAYCWDSMDLSRSTDLVPDSFKLISYSYIAAGKDHVCAVRGPYYTENNPAAGVDCWDVYRVSNTTLSARESSRFNDPYINNLVFNELVSGDGFSCGSITNGGITCWGPNAAGLGVSGVSESFGGLASGANSLCAASEASGEVKCWVGNVSEAYVSTSPDGIRFISLSAGARHYCGIRRDNHGVECWGEFNETLVPKDSGFLAIASSDALTCGVRESDLVLDCWFSIAVYDPPLQLCSPGLCTPGSCGEGMFTFNASLLNEPDLTSLCVRKDLSICSPCGVNCSNGFYPSSPCSQNSDRICTSCSLCQNSSCSNVCGLQPSPEMRHKHFDQLLRQLLLIVGSCVVGFSFILVCYCFLTRAVAKANEEEGKRKPLYFSCIRKPKQENDSNSEQHPPATVAPCPGIAQLFRLTELKDATNGFKEFNELGRGSYGFVYKAVLSDGRQVAVKRANAATIIHTNSRDFETELEILCSLRHSNIVNLLGYCAEMGERLLVYEFMPHGSLHDHLHNGLSTLNWSLRLKIAMQAAKGLEYLHKEIVPPIVHRDVKSLKILLDSDWVARISGFGLLKPDERDAVADTSTDVYGFGVVLLEILSGRKAYDTDFYPSNIVDWALPQIRQGKAAAVIDRYVALPRNVEPLLKLAEIAELALKEDPTERASMSELADLLDQLVCDGLVL